MTTKGEHALAEVVEAANKEARRKAALYKAIGLDRVPEEQRELTLNIAKRYDLDLLLRHVILVDGRPYLTRDGLLHIAHRSGQLDGIEVTDPEVAELADGKFWRARASVYRKDMSRPFTYAGRYPVSGSNRKFAPEMAVKVAEVMALRRAFDVSAPVVEERWDRVEDRPEPPRPSLAEQVEARRAEVTTSEPSSGELTAQAPARPSGVVASSAEPASSAIEGEAPEPAGPGLSPEAPTLTMSMTMPAPPDTAAEICGAWDEEMGACKRMPGHKGNHQASDGQSWK